MNKIEQLQNLRQNFFEQEKPLVEDILREAIFIFKQIREVDPWSKVWDTKWMDYGSDFTIDIDNEFLWMSDDEDDYKLPLVVFENEKKREQFLMQIKSLVENGQ